MKKQPYPRYDNQGYCKNCPFMRRFVKTPIWHHSMLCKRYHDAYLRYDASYPGYLREMDCMMDFPNTRSGRYQYTFVWTRLQREVSKSY